MRILYLSQYFPPEAGATQNRAYEMASNFVRLGHSVTMLAEIPNHPSGIIPPEYRGRLLERADLDGIDVIRVWVRAHPVKDFRGRLAFYLSYMVNAALAGLLLARGHYDLVYASSPPLFTGGAGLALSWMRRLPLVFEVRDLWPESAVALGEISNRRYIAWATRLEEACYRRAAAVVAVTQGICTRLARRGLPPEKLWHVPNGANVETLRFNPEGRTRLRGKLGINGQFVVVYTGIHGLAQGLESVIEAAHLLQADPSVQFMLVGEGPCKTDLSRLVKAYALTNLHMLPEVPANQISEYLSAADAALVPLRKADLFTGVIPTKMFDAWACERPVLLCVSGEARQVLEAAGGGLYVEPEDPADLVRSILALRAAPELADRMGKGGRSYTEKYFSRRAQAENLAARLQALCKK